MKKNFMSVAILSTIGLGSTQAMADGHLDTITSALKNGKLTGQVYGGLTRTREVDSTVPATTTQKETDSELDFDFLRMGYVATVKDNVEYGVEIQLDPGNDVDSSSNVTIRDLYIAKDIGNEIVTLGRFKPIYDRTDAIEQSDALFTDPSIGLRIDGIEIKGVLPIGLNYSASFKKAGTKLVLTNDSGNTDSDLQDTFGFSTSLGWQGTNNNVQFGGYLAINTEDGNDTTDKTNGIATVDNNLATDTFIFAGNISAGFFNGILHYSEIEEELDDSITQTITTTERDGYTAYASFNLGGANRSFNDYGVLQGPKLSKDQWGQEIVVKYGQSTLELSDNGVLAPVQTEIDIFGIGYNAYCNEYTKIYALFEKVENAAKTKGVQGSTNENVETISIGLRLAF